MRKSDQAANHIDWTGVQDQHEGKEWPKPLFYALVFARIHTCIYTYTYTHTHNIVGSEATVIARPQ